MATDGTCDVLNVQGDLSLNGLTLQVADLGQLGKAQRYTIITHTGALSGVFSATNVVKPWYVFYDRVGHTVQIRADSGTLLRLL